MDCQLEGKKVCRRIACIQLTIIQKNFDSNIKNEVAESNAGIQLAASERQRAAVAASGEQARLPNLCCYIQNNTAQFSTEVARILRPSNLYKFP